MIEKIKPVLKRLGGAVLNRDFLRSFASLSLIFVSSAIENAYVGMPSKSSNPFMHTPRFHFSTQAGKGLGSIASGVLAYCYTPELSLLVFTRLAVVMGFFSVCTAGYITESEAALNWTWFLLGFCAYGLFVVRFTHTVESVSANMTVYIGLLFFGLQFSLERAYAYFVFRVYHQWQNRLFGTAFAFCIMQMLLDLIPLRRKRAYHYSNYKESLREKARDPVFLTYAAGLTFLWFLLGAAGETIQSRDHGAVYKVVTNACSKVMVTFLCVWQAGQKRAVTAALLFLSSICCFAFFFTQWSTNTEALITINQTWSFLVSSPLCIMWLLTAEVFGNGTRYVILGICSCACRIGSALGTCADDAGIYQQWPTFLLGLGSLVSVLILFSVPESVRGLPPETDTDFYSRYLTIRRNSDGTAETSSTTNLPREGDEERGDSSYI